MKTWILAMMVFLAACEPMGQGEVDKSRAEDIGLLITQGKLKFAQDQTSGLCFAYGWAGSNGGPIVTWVPCDSLQVEAK